MKIREKTSLKLKFKKTETKKTETQKTEIKITEIKITEIKKIEIKIKFNSKILMFGNNLNKNKFQNK